MSNVTSITAPTPQPAPASGTTAAAGGIIDIGDPTKMPDHSVTFSEVLSTLNPLQYIPIIGSIYRSITGDAAPQAAQVLGGALLGGPLGLIASAANSVIEQSTGKDVGEHLIASLFPQGDTPATPQNQRYAANTPTAPTSTTAAPAMASAATTNAASPSPSTAVASAATPSAAAAEPSAQTPAPAPSAVQQQPAPPVSQAPASTSPTASPSAPLARGVAAGRAASSGYTLADYRTFAGHGVPPSSGANGAQFRNDPVPLQTTIPLPNDVSRTPVVLTNTQTPTNVAPAAPAAKAAQPEDTWVSQAMMRGLDRYRDMMRQQDQQQSGSQQQPASQPQATSPAAASQ